MVYAGGRVGELQGSVPLEGRMLDWSKSLGQEAAYSGWRKRGAETGGNRARVSESAEAKWVMLGAGLRHYCHTSLYASIHVFHSCIVHFLSQVLRVQ
jgi:hypothetical protein